MVFLPYLLTDFRKCKIPWPVSSILLSDVTIISLLLWKKYIGFQFISEFISKLLLWPSKHFKIFNLPICQISLLHTFPLETYDPLISICSRCPTFVQQMVAGRLLLLPPLFGTHYPSHFVPAHACQHFFLDWKHIFFHHRLPFFPPCLLKWKPVRLSHHFLPFLSSWIQ